MSVSQSLAALVGYDRTVVAGLGAGHARSLALQGALGMVPVALVAVSAAVGLRFAGSPGWMAAGLGAFMGFYMLALLRVSVAGGGAAPHQAEERARKWSPRLVPVLLFAFLGVFFAQPTFLLLRAPALDPEIAKYREALIAMHARAVLAPVRQHAVALKQNVDDATRALAKQQARVDKVEAELRPLSAGADGQEVEARVLKVALADATRQRDRAQDNHRWFSARLAETEQHEQHLRSTEVTEYARHLGASQFLVRRIRLAWQDPWPAAGWTLGNLVLFILPFLIGRYVGIHALRAYETERRLRMRAAAEAAFNAFKEEMRAVLRTWDTFDGQTLEMFTDPPFNTTPRFFAGRKTHRINRQELRKLLGAR